MRPIDEVVKCQRTLQLSYCWDSRYCRARGQGGGTAEFKGNAMRRRLLARPEIADGAEGFANGGQAVAGELQSDRICKALESAVKAQRSK